MERRFATGLGQESGESRWQTGAPSDEYEMCGPGRVQTDKVMAMFHSLADLNQGLIEKKEIPGLIGIFAERVAGFFPD